MLKAFFDFVGRPLSRSSTHFGGGGGVPRVFWRDMSRKSGVGGSMVALADNSESDKLESRLIGEGVVSYCTTA